MAQPKVGITAEFILKEFLKNQKKYEKALKDISKATKNAAFAVNNSAQSMIKNWIDFEKRSKSIQDAINAQDWPKYSKLVNGASKAFQDMGSQAKINIPYFDELTKKGVASGEAFQLATQKMKVNIDLYQQLRDKGLSMAQAYDALVAGQRGVEAGFKLIATGAKAAATAISTLATIIRKSVDDYVEAGQEIRKLNDAFGITVEQANEWRNAAIAQGQSAQTLARAFTQVASNLVNYRIRLAEGEETTLNFQRALDTLGVSVENTDGTMRDSQAIIDDVNDALRELGPGWTTAGLAQDIYGRGAYTTVLPAILDQTLSMQELNDIARTMGATMSVEDVQATNEFRKATTRLDYAIQGAKNTIARAYTPTLTRLKDTIANLIGIVNIRDAQARAEADKQEALRKGTISLAEAQDYYTERLNFYRGVTSEVVKSEEELRLERLKARQEAALAELQERKLAEQREEAMQKIVDLQQKYNEKRADIEQDFSDRWQDILIDRARDAEDRTTEMFQKLEDIWTKNSRKLEDISIKAQNRLADLERDQAERVDDFQEQANRKREDLELKHQERLYKIQTRYLDTVEEAARRNDAVAVVAAIRRRNRELRDAERQRQVEQRDLGRDLDERRREINRDYDRRKQDALRQQAEEEAAAQLALDRALEDLKLANDREREEILLKYRREKEDFDRAKSRALRDAQTWYRREEQELQQHLQTMEQTAVQSVISTTSQVSAEVAAGVARIAGIANTALGTIGGGVVRQYSSAALEAWRNRVTPRGVIGGRAEGGVDVVNRPTTVTMGEAGSELHAFIPLRGAMNISHRFSRLPIDINGAQGMDRGQVQSIVYDAMTDLARQLSPRWTRRR